MSFAYRLFATSVAVPMSAQPEACAGVLPSELLENGSGAGQWDDLLGGAIVVTDSDESDDVEVDNHDSNVVMDMDVDDAWPMISWPLGSNIQTRGGRRWRSGGGRREERGGRATRRLRKDEADKGRRGQD